MPLLQHALLELWKRRHGRWLRAEEYRAVGGVKKAIAETADRLYNALPPDEQDQVRDIFLRLTRLDDNVDQGGEYRNTRRRMSLSDLVPAGSEPEKTKDIVNRLANDALVVTSRNELTGEEEVEVAHEALIRYWARLRSWIDEDFDLLRLRDSISEAAKQYERNPSDPSLLVHRGSKLDAINEALSSTRLTLTKAEEDYVEACRQLVISELEEAKSRAATLRRRARAIYLLLVAVIAGLLGWINQSFIAKQWRWYTVERPYMAAHFQSHVLTSTKEQLLKPGDPFKECDADCPEMIVVRAGTFMMGPPETDGSAKGSEKKVTIPRPFAVSETELTFSDWKACVAGGGCTNYNSNETGPGRGIQPVVWVTWDDAQAYVAWLSKMTGKRYRLLSEAEYEYATRAGSMTVYPWGNDIKLNGTAMANCASCGSKWDNKGPAPVRSFAKNEFGLYDMVGNVWEWVEDCWYPDYDDAPTDSSARIACDDPRIRVARGGAWDNDPKYLHSANRLRVTTGGLDLDVGFRVARTLTAP